MRVRRETALDGLAGEQMWVRKGLMKKGNSREREKKRESISIDWSVT